MPQNERLQTFSCILMCNLNIEDWSICDLSKLKEFKSVHFYLKTKFTSIFTKQNSLHSKFIASLHWLKCNLIEVFLSLCCFLISIIKHFNPFYDHNSNKAKLLQSNANLWLRRVPIWINSVLISLRQRVFWWMVVKLRWKS